MTTALATRDGTKMVRRNSKPQQYYKPAVALPEYLEQREAEAILRQAPHAQARLVMLAQWRAGLRISEALALLVADVDFDGMKVRVRRGKGNKSRLVPLHPELAAAFRNYLDYRNAGRGNIFDANRTTAWRWVQSALEKTVELNQVPPGKKSELTLCGIRRPGIG
jgi:integrase